MFRALCAHHQEVKTVLYSIWYRHTCKWPSRAQVERGLRKDLCTGRSLTGVTIPDAVQYSFDLLMISTQCSKHVEAYNKLIINKILFIKLFIEYCLLALSTSERKVRCGMRIRISGILKLPRTLGWTGIAQSV